MSAKKILALFVFIAVFGYAFVEIIDPDFGWHLRTGEYIVTTFSIPYRDIFSFTAFGQPWITEEWLTEVVIYLLYRSGGNFAVMVFFALVPAVALTFVYWRSEAHPAIAALAAVFASTVVAAFWGARPQMISFLFASIFLFFLERYRREGARRYLWWLVPLQLIWTNAHGAFLIGPALVLVYLLADSAQTFLQWRGQVDHLKDLGRLTRVFLACVAVIAINPNGLSLYAYPIQTLTSPVIQNVVVEWQPPDLTSPGMQPFVWFLAAFITLLALAPRRRVGLVDAILLFGLTLASFRQSRQIALWILIVTPILGASAIEVLQSLSWNRVQNIGAMLARNARTACAVGLIALSVLAFVRINRVLANEPLAERQYFPVAAVDYIQKNGLSGPIYNRYEWGGYLIWRLYPHERVFIDGRTDVYGLTDSFFYSQYAAAYNAGPNWNDTLRQYNIRLVLVDAHAPLTDTLAKDAQWKQIYADEEAVVFTKK